ncbi:hypothetical protein BsWGS_16853 [Bradybaena similaris]
MIRIVTAILLASLDVVGGMSCSSTTVGFLTARQSAYSLLSPGYPSDYENNQNCRWLISAQDDYKKVQIEVISVNLANWDGGPCEDYLEIKDGNTEDAPLVKQWCDPEQFQFKSKGQHVFIKFVTDHHFTASGFAFKYYQIDDYKSQCDPFNIRTIQVGENPVFLDLPLYTNRMNNEVTCDYHLKSQFNDDVTINLELLTFSEILCDDGSFAIYDGSSHESPLIINWCYQNQPFQRLISSGKDLFIRFRLIKTDTDWIVFRAKAAANFKSISCSDKSIPNLEVGPVPTILAYPLHHKSASTRACPLRLWAEKLSQTVRVEVLSKEPPCGSRGVRVYDGYDLSPGMIGLLCDKTVFASSTHNFVLSPVNDNNTKVVFLKISAIDAACNGQTEKRKADHDEVKELPELANSKTGYAHDLNCTYLLESSIASDAIQVTLSGRMVTRDMFECDGDAVTLYDGDTTASPVLTTWCGANDQGKRYTSRGPKMLVTVKSDSHSSYQGVKIKYYTVPQMGGCSLVTDLEANSTFQYLMSPNYPLYYPINSYCEYKLSAPEGYFIRFEVLHSRMENDCSDNVRVYSGLKQMYEKYLGRWCGDEKPKYKSEGREMLIVFSADDEFNSGGFHARFYADKDTSSNYLIPAIVGSLLLVIIVIVIIIVIIYVFARRRKGGP